LDHLGKPVDPKIDLAHLEAGVLQAEPEIQHRQFFELFSQLSTPN
jgi:hypothetical protein